MLLESLIGAAALATLFPVLILFIEVLPALFVSEHGALPAAPRPRIAVVIPAHNEAGGIGETVRALAPQLQRDDVLLVVADNCTDETAAVAARAGAEVVVRHEPALRGKGYALDFAMRHLERMPPEAVLILDADCKLAAGSVQSLAQLCTQRCRPVQALNLSRAPAGAGVKMRIAEFASVLKNRVRALGLERLGLPCQLTGTGMCFPWALIRNSTLATGHIVEDLKLGLELAAAGYPPLFCPQAQVTSEFPASEAGFNSQRTRWEHGYLGVLLKDAPRVLLGALLRFDGRLLAMGLDLCVPPLALLSLLATAVWLGSALLYLLAGAEFPLIVASAAVMLLTFCVLSCWARYGRGILSLGTLALAVVYALSKLPVYGRFLVARQIDWVRSRRDHDRSA